MTPRSLLLASWARRQRFAKRGRVFTSVGSSRFLFGLSLSALLYYVVPNRLREFERAPESVQAQFWTELRRRLDCERAENEALSETHGVEVASDHHLIEWDDRWRRRARSARALLRNPERRPFPREEIEALLEIPARTYVAAITAEHVPPHGRVRCPHPDHDDLHPDCAVYEHGWRCFACGSSGNIYTFASLLWDLPLNGPGFVELHNRLKAALA